VGSFGLKKFIARGEGLIKKGSRKKGKGQKRKSAKKGALTEDYTQPETHCCSTEGAHH
jgi:hypothetical protein